jgi:hypothetical protein
MPKNQSLARLIFKISWNIYTYIYLGGRGSKCEGMEEREREREREKESEIQPCARTHANRHTNTNASHRTITDAFTIHTLAKSVARLMLKAARRSDPCCPAARISSASCNVAVGWACPALTAEQTVALPSLTFDCSLACPLHELESSCRWCLQLSSDLRAE